MYLHPVSNSYCLRASGWFFDELKYADLDVLGPIVTPLGEVSTYTFLLISSLNVSEVGDKSVFQSKQSLSHILLITSGACNCIDQVRASAGDLFHAVEALSCKLAVYLACFVQEGAVSAVPPVTEGVSSRFTLASVLLLSGCPGGGGLYSGQLCAGTGWTLVLHTWGKIVRDGTLL